MSSTIFVYLHGFNSGFDPMGSKVLALENIGPVVGLTINYLDPDSVAELDKFIENLDSGSEEIILVGTSLGGYFARFFAKKHKLRCILFNPSVRPWETLLNYIGENTNYVTGEKVDVTSANVYDLKKYHVDGSTGSGCFALLATDDELLDWKEAATALTKHAEMYLTTGGHRLSDINSHLTNITKFVNRFPVSNETSDDSK